MSLAGAASRHGSFSGTKTKTYYCRMPSPVGNLLLAGDGERLALLYMQAQEGWAEGQDRWIRDEAPFVAVREQLRAYFAKELTQFDVPLMFDGSPFQLKVWEALTGIPFGVTTSYGELARQLGDAKASRAVGLANGRNRIGIIVPCHRVIGADGSLTGYAGGLDNKRWLLRHEGALLL